MPTYVLTEKGNVIELTNKNYFFHTDSEKYQGTYENALKYFGVDKSEVKSYGKLINIIIYHQTNIHTTQKLSNELYDILYRAQSEHKYWAEEKHRHENCIYALEQAKGMNIIYDDVILDKLRLKANDENLSYRKRALYLSRISAYEKWKKSL